MHAYVRARVLSNHIPISLRRRAKKAIPRSIERDRRRCIGDDRYCPRYRRRGESPSSSSSSSASSSPSPFLASSRRVWRRLVFCLHFAGNSGGKRSGNVTARRVLRRLHIARECARERNGSPQSLSRFALEYTLGLYLLSKRKDISAE